MKLRVQLQTSRQTGASLFLLYFQRFQCSRVFRRYKKREADTSAGQANLPSKQQPHDGEEYGQNEEHIGGAHPGVVGQLVRLPADLIDVEADWEYERGHTEQDHCDRKTEEEH